MATPPTRVLGTTPTVGWASTATPKTTPAFDVQAGDLIILQAFSENSDAIINTPTWTGTGTWTLRQSIVASGYCTAYLYTCAVTATQAGRTIAMTTPLTYPQWSFIASVWRNHGGLGVTGKANTTGAPSLSLVTAANSAVVVGNSDWNATSGTRTWRTINGAPITETSFGGTAGVTYMCYTGYRIDTGTAGTNTYGMTAPTGQRYAITGAEILGTAGSIPNTGTATTNITCTGTAAGKRAPIGSSSSSITRTGTASGSTTRSGTASNTITHAGAAAGERNAQGASSSMVTYVGAASGKRSPQGSSTSMVVGAGSAAGVAPQLDVRAGSAATAVTHTATATGRRSPLGASASVQAYAGAAVGKRLPVGVGSGMVTHAGAAAGLAPGVGMHMGSAITTIVHVGAAAGSTIRSGSATTTITGTTSATGQQAVPTHTTITATGRTRWTATARAVGITATARQLWKGKR